jgi:hypothetical protein
MPVANQRLKVLEARVRARVDETLARARLSVKVQKAIFKVWGAQSPSSSMSNSQ